MQADLRERQGVAVIFRRHLERFGGLRILVNNAGDMVERVPTAETTEALWRSAIDLNLSSVFFACQEAIGPMSAQKGAVSSIFPRSVPGPAEAPSRYPITHGFHHEKDGVGLTADEDFLLSLCFCPACLARAAMAGVDGEKARATVKLWITEACERAIPASRWPEFLSAGLDVFQPHPEVYDFVKWRFEPVTSLIGEIRDHAAPSTKIYLIDLKEGWLGGCDVKAAAAACDGAIICGYDMTPDQVTELIAQNRTAVGPDRHLGTGFRVFYPEMRSPADLATRANAARKAGAQSINFYNYGLVPGARLNWVKHAISAASR